MKQTIIKSNILFTVNDVIKLTEWFNKHFKADSVAEITAIDENLVITIKDN